MSPAVPGRRRFVVRKLCRAAAAISAARATLDDYLKENNITGIEGVDTRALTKILRSQGSMNGMITCAEHFNLERGAGEV